MGSSRPREHTFYCQQRKGPPILLITGRTYRLDMGTLVGESSDRPPRSSPSRSRRTPW